MLAYLLLVGFHHHGSGHVMFATRRLAQMEAAIKTGLWPIVNGDRVTALDRDKKPACQTNFKH